eukprot:7666595-Alexandrium_andersonii.AAC.1
MRPREHSIPRLCAKRLPASMTFTCACPSPPTMLPKVLQHASAFAFCMALCGRSKGVEDVGP